MKINETLKVNDLGSKVERLFEIAGKKIASIHATWDPESGAPVYTVDGKYSSRGWTEWTQGFRYGCALLQFEASRDERFLSIGREGTGERMVSHLTHIGVHDHGFNTISSYGNLRRMIIEGALTDESGEHRFCELAIKVSGAVQASRWTRLNEGKGYIYSFNGPHSLFCDTIRTCRVLGLSHQLGQVLLGENDRTISLLERMIRHAETTARFNVYYGEGRDAYDVRGRVAHESVFNVNDGNYRCPSTQQGYSPFSTWTRGLSWVVTGYAELLEFLEVVRDDDLEPFGGRDEVEEMLRKPAVAASDFYIEQGTAADGITYWDTGAPGLEKMGDWRTRRADPFNAFEPVDSGAAAVTAQGLYRLGSYLGSQEGSKYRKAALTIADALFAPPYLSEDEGHQGLLLHQVYHRPNGWDHVQEGQSVPNGESCMWGDYHLMEFAMLLRREVAGQPYLTFFDKLGEGDSS